MHRFDMNGADRPLFAPRPRLKELARQCQKLGHPHIGSWMARRIARPLALRVTWLAAPWGVSAHTATLAAWGTGLIAATAFCLGNLGGWLLGAALWQLYYLLDHVDGQLARLRRTESLDGAQLDYWMHHSVPMALASGMGYGLFARSGEPAWLGAGFAWGMALLIAGLEPDTRAKAFLLRLKRLSGELRVVGGGGGRPQPAPRPGRSPRKLASWTLRKSLEAHVLMNVVLIVAVVQFLLDDTALICSRIMLGLLAPASVVASAAIVVRSLRRGAAEEEFAAWFRLPPGCELMFHEGWWIVERSEPGQADEFGKLPPARPRRSS